MKPYTSLLLWSQWRRITQVIVKNTHTTALDVTVQTNHTHTRPLLLQEQWRTHTHHHYSVDPPTVPPPPPQYHCSLSLTEEKPYTTAKSFPAVGHLKASTFYWRNNSKTPRTTQTPMTMLKLRMTVCVWKRKSPLQSAFGSWRECRAHLLLKWHPGLHTTTFCPLKNNQFDHSFAVLLCDQIRPPTLPHHPFDW